MDCGELGHFCLFEMGVMGSAEYGIEYQVLGVGAWIVGVANGVYC